MRPSGPYLDRCMSPPYCGRGRGLATPTGMAGLVEFVELDARP